MNRVVLTCPRDSAYPVRNSLSFYKKGWMTKIKLDVKHIVDGLFSYYLALPFIPSIKEYDKSPFLPH